MKEYSVNAYVANKPNPNNKTQVWKEDQWITTFRKSLFSVLSSFDIESKLSVSLIFDTCLSIRNDDIEKGKMLVSSVCVERFWSIFTNKFIPDTLKFLELNVMLEDLNCKLIDSKQFNTVILTPEEKPYFPFYMFGLSSEKKVNEIVNMVTYTSDENAIECLVFYYGMRHCRAVELVGNIRNGKVVEV